MANEISRSQKDKYHLGTATRGNLQMLIPQKLGLLGRVTRVWRERRVGLWALSCPPAGTGHSEALLCCRATSGDNCGVTCLKNPRMDFESLKL